MIQRSQQLIDIYMNTERYNDALVFIKEIIEILKKIGTKKEFANNLNDLGRVYQNTGEFDLATECFTQSLNISKEIDYKLGTSIALTNFGIQLRQEGRFEKALETLLQSETICTKEAFIENSIVNFLSLSSLYFDIGNIEKSIMYTKKAENALTVISFDEAYIIPHFFGQLSNNYFGIGDIEKSTELLEKGINICKARGFQITQAQMMLNLGMRLIEKDDLESAYTTYMEALSIFKNFNNKRWIARTLSNLGSLFGRENNFQNAVKFYKDSQKIAQSENELLLMVRNYRNLGHAYLVQDNHYESYRNYTQCLILYEVIVRNINLPHLKESFRENFNDLPKIIHSLNINLESGKFTPNISEIMMARKAAIKTCKKLKVIDPTLPKDHLIQELGKNIILINDLKGSRLETDTRKLFRRELGFEIEDSGKNWDILEEDITFLMHEKCQKDSGTKTIEIDIFGNKKENGKVIYILGECKFRNRKIKLDEIKCFLIKTSIISKKITNFDFENNNHFFKLALISIEGFPDKAKINLLLDKYWDLPKNLLINKTIDLIDRDQFIKLLKKNNISFKIYKNY